MIKPIVIFALTLLLCACRSETDSSKNAPEAAAGQEAATDKPSQVAEVAFDQVMADITRDWLRLSPTSASALDVSEKIAGGRYIDRLDQTGPLSLDTIGPSLIQGLPGFDVGIAKRVRQIGKPDFGPHRLLRQDGIFEVAEAEPRPYFMNTPA